MSEAEARDAVVAAAEAFGELPPLLAFSDKGAFAIGKLLYALSVLKAVRAGRELPPEFPRAQARKRGGGRRKP